MIRVFVKGSPTDLEKECEIRHLAPSDIRVVNDHETRADISDESWDVVAQWFHETPECKEGVGYPPGTLLFFNTWKR